MSVQDSARISRATDNGPDLRPVDRYEWTQILRRIRFRAVIGASSRIGKDGRPTRGGVAPATVKAVALLWASYADVDGGNIRPGDAALAVDAEVAVEVVKAVKAALIAHGLVRRTAAGTRRTGWCDVYQLTLPADLLERLEVLTPAQHELAAEAIRAKRRRKPRTGSGGPRSGDGVQGPPDPVATVDNPPVRGPADPVDGADPPTCTGSFGGTSDPCTGSVGSDVRGPSEACTNHDQTTTTTNHSERDLRTAVTVSRARPPDEDPISGEVVATSAPPPAAGPEKCEHGLSRSGKIRCPACRRSAYGPAMTVRAAPPPPDHDCAAAANVVAFRPRTRTA